MPFFALLLCFLTLSIQCTENTRLNDNEALYSEQKAQEIIDKAQHSFDDHNLLLNLLYHMYYFAQLDAVYRKNITLSIDQLLNAQDSLDPSHGFDETIMKQLFSQVIVLERRRSLHGQTWQLLDTQISNDHTELAHTVNAIKKVSEHLIHLYTQRCIPEIDHMLQEEQKNLEQKDRTTHVISRTIDMLLNQPELLGVQKDMQGLQTINILYGLSDRTSKEMKQLIASKIRYTQYAYDLQLVAAHFFKQCYDALHDKIAYDFPDCTVKVLIAQNGVLASKDSIIKTQSKD